MAQPGHCRINSSPMITLEYKFYNPEINSKAFFHEKLRAPESFIQPGVVVPEFLIEPVAQKKPGYSRSQKQTEKYRQHLLIKADCCKF